MLKKNESISIKVENYVADIRLNRPEKLNSLSENLIEDLIEASSWVKRQSNIRCVVLSGQGRGFCAGMDMASFQSMASGEFSDLMERTHGITNIFQQVVWGWRECKVPVIAAVQGVALGGGFQIMLGADIRIAHPETKMSIMEMKWGLVPDMAGTALMCHLASEDIIRELTYTGRVFSGEEAKSLGLVTHLSGDPLAQAMSLAEDIASKSPDAIRAAKQLFNRAADHRAKENLQSESDLQTEILMKPNQLEAVKATLEKREPSFK